MPMQCIRSFCPQRLPAERRWRASVEFAERRIELPRAAEACFNRDIGHGHIRLIQQTLGRLGPQGLRNLLGGRADMFLKQPAQMPFSNAQTVRKRADGAAIEGALRDQPHGPVGCCAGAVPCRAEGSGFRAASQAGAKACLFCRRRAWIERHVLCHRRFHAADRTAVDAGRPHTDEKQTIKRGVALAHSFQACCEIKHGGSLSQHRRR